jgi:phosphatidylglycerophosphatase A
MNENMLLNPPIKPSATFLLAHPAHCIALGLGAGLARKAPGTWGTFAALPLFYAAQYWCEQWQVPATLVLLSLAVWLFLVGMWACGVTQKALGVADHGGMVIDEIAAMFLVLIFAPVGWLGAFWAFVWFRFFDIVKPWPISAADARFKNGFGVMFDDLLAAIGSIAVLQFTFWFAPNLFI